MAYVFEPTVSVESTVCAGVTFILHRMTEDRKLELMDVLRGPTKKNQELLAQAATISAMKSDNSSKEDLILINSQLQDVYNEQLTLEKREGDPAYIRWGLAGIEGLVLAGKKEGSLANLMSWPSELVDEAKGLILKGTQLTVEESKNSKPATITTDPRQPALETTTAKAVSNEEPTLEKIANIPS